MDPVLYLWETDQSGLELVYEDRKPLPANVFEAPILITTRPEALYSFLTYRRTSA